jgi:hypothetical protein
MARCRDSYKLGSTIDKMLVRDWLDFCEAPEKAPVLDFGALCSTAPLPPARLPERRRLRDLSDTDLNVPALPLKRVEGARDGFAHSKSGFG